MNNQKHPAETARRISELANEGARLWVARDERLRQSLWLMGLAIALFVAAQVLGPVVVEMLAGQSPDAAQTVSELLSNSFLVAPAVMLFTSCALFVDSLRLRFKVESIDLEMRRLDPEARFLTSGPEELGRAVRAALDKRRN